MPESRPPTPRTEVRRLPARAAYERALVEAILDEGLVCHVGFTTNHGPVVIPTTYARDGDRLLLHGSPASRMLRSLKAGVDVCVTVTLLDGLVLARSTFHHSMNYRSVVIFGTAVPVEDPAEKAEAMRLLVEHIVPGRTADAREASARELQATLVLALPLAEASAKVRTGMPIDDDEDLGLPVWAGVLPFAPRPGAPEPDPQMDPEVGLPHYVSGYERPSTG